MTLQLQACAAAVPAGAVRSRSDVRSFRRRHRSTSSPLTRPRAADKFCRDVVSTRKDKASIVDGDSDAAVTFVGAGGKEITISCKKSEYILDAGLEAGLELPYTCRAGICGACVGKIVAGEVDQSDVRCSFFLFFSVSSGVDAPPLKLQTNVSLSHSRSLLLFRNPIP